MVEINIPRDQKPRALDPAPDLRYGHHAVAIGATVIDKEPIYRSKSYYS